jgi:integrase
VGRGRRRFGRVRRLKSGRWQARHLGPDGRDRAAPQTFATKRDAERWLSAAETDIGRGKWIDPSASQTTIEQWSKLWLSNRSDLKVRTRELYEWLLGKYIVPQLGDVPLGKITPALVRSWHAEISRVGSPTPVRQSYSLLRAMLGTAVADEVILRNPCAIKGAGISRAVERPVATIPQVMALAEAVPARYRAFVLTATWSSARWGELVALTRDRLDLLDGTMRVDRQLVELRGCRLQPDTPKSEAGVRVIHLPPHLIPELEHHLATFVPAVCTYVFPNSKGEPIKRSSFRSVWLLARSKAGMPTIRFHDLRHTGNTLAAATGASTRELMARMGHSSMRAALIYQHATKDRDAAIAAALSDMVAGPAVELPPATAVKIGGEDRDS